VERGRVPAARAGAERGRTRLLCLGQHLCGDAAATVFHCPRLEPILQALGARGYRAVQLEGGVAAERLQLAAFALGLGATGVTFFDDDVSAFFGKRAAPMLTVAVGFLLIGHGRAGARTNCRALPWGSADEAGHVPATASAHAVGPSCAHRGGAARAACSWPAR
jgi:hypothetical protein